MANYNYPYYSAQQNGMTQPYYPRYVMPEQPQLQVGIKGRPVSSIDEVRATSIDFDGSIFYFPDTANKRIYTKQINLDGTSTLNIYELKPMPADPSQRYVTREEFEAVLAQISSRLQGGTAASEAQSAPYQVQSQQTSQTPVTTEQTKAPVQPQNPQTPKFNF